MDISAQFFDMIALYHAGRDKLLCVIPGELKACGDHRIAMSMAVAATVTDGPVTIEGAEAVAKSYPAFFEDYEALGGRIRREN